MEESILNSTKEILNLPADDQSFELAIVTHINSALATLLQIGIGEALTSIEDESAVWEDLDIPEEQLPLVKTYIFLKVELMWDPPTTSWLLEAKQKQILEHEDRLYTMREEALHDV